MFASKNWKEEKAQVAQETGATEAQIEASINCWYLKKNLRCPVPIDKEGVLAVIRSQLET